MNLFLRSCEILLAITFIIGGINGIFLISGWQPLLPNNPNSEFATLLTQTNYIFMLQKSVELISGILLLFHRFTIAAILALTPIVFSIFLYHIFDDVDYVMIGILVMALYLISVFKHRKNILQILKMN